MEALKKMKAMVSLLRTKEIANDDFAKDEFKRIGKAALKALAKELPFIELTVWFNEGGHAVPGDLILHGMFEQGRGIYIHVSQHCWDGSKVSCFCRAVTSMKDYRGKRNVWLKDTDLLDIERLKETLVSVSMEALPR